VQSKKLFVQPGTGFTFSKMQKKKKNCGCKLVLDKWWNWQSRWWCSMIKHWKNSNNY